MAFIFRYFVGGWVRLVRILVWFIVSSRFLAFIVRVWEVVSICRLYFSFREVTVFCWVSRILLMSLVRFLLSSFWVFLICRKSVRKSLGV